jgi:hypothetical protein
MGLGVIDWRKNEGQKSRDTVPLIESKIKHHNTYVATALGSSTAQAGSEWTIG